ncbi:MAG: glutamate--tRNA ligase [bacterium]|nr:glutamate--tRNA ligase [bacterium]
MKTVRFAPSPTGHLHIGGVRTALFNYLFARNQQGEYVLRIEDTDVSRSSAHMAEEIIAGMKWLGFHWDKGPFYQSQRFDLYKTHALRLLEEKKAYRCFCTPEELEQRRNNGGEKQRIFKYDRKCLHVEEDAIAEKLQQNIPHVFRFRIPDGKTYFKDSLHKEMKTENEELEDFVILKSDGSPTYHLSVVVDDNDMGITNVIRGDDHLSNTFKQVLLFKALELKPPKYAHLPLILGPDKKKLSKRHGETSVLEFKNQGYLPEAIINYLSQLSWIPADTKKIFSMEELAKQFALSKLSKNSPVFDYDKLRFLNGRAIQRRDPAVLYGLLTEDKIFADTYASVEMGKKTALIQLVKPRMKTLEEFKEKFAGYLADEAEYNAAEREKLNIDYPDEKIIEYLGYLVTGLEGMDAANFTGPEVEAVLRECAESNGVKAADMIHPARFALTGETVSPSIFEVFAFFGKDNCLKRLNALVTGLNA